MSTIPILLLKDGNTLAIARVDSDGTLRRAALRSPIQVNGSGSSFADTDELIIEKTFTEPSRGVPLVIERRNVSPFCEQPGIRGMVNAIGGGLAYCHSPASPALHVFDGTEWAQQAEPEGVSTTCAYISKSGDVRIIGARGRHPVMLEAASLVEVPVPWRRRWWSLSVGSEGPMMSVTRSRLGTVIIQDEGYFDRQVTTVYLKSDDEWYRRYVGNTRPVAVHDPDAMLPPVLLRDGRWLELLAGKLEHRPPLGLSPNVVIGRSRASRLIWTGACAANGRVTVLVTAWPVGRTYLVQGAVGGQLDVLSSWDTTGTGPRSIRLIDEDQLDWV